MLLLKYKMIELPAVKVKYLHTISSEQDVNLIMFFHAIYVCDTDATIILLGTDVT